MTSCQLEASPERAKEIGSASIGDRPWLQDGRFVSHERSPLFAKYAGTASILVSGRPSDRIPLVSIVIPTFRRPDLLEQAVRSALGQTGFSDFEVIVVDNDAEADETSETARMLASIGDSRLLYFRNASNIGLEGNFNRTVEIGRGRYVCQLHDDDWLSPAYLSRLMSRLPKDAEFLSSLVGMGDDDYRPDAITPPERPGRLQHLSRFDAVHSIVSVAPALYLRSAVLELGGYDGQRYPVLDYVLFADFVRRGRSYVLKEVLSYYRTTDSVTFKGNTLVRQIEGSMEVKRQLVADTHPLLGRLFYVESVRRQFERAAEHGISFEPMIRGRRDRIASWLARHHRSGQAFGGVMKGVRAVLLLMAHVVS